MPSKVERHWTKLLKKLIIFDKRVKIPHVSNYFSEKCTYVIK